MEYRTLGASDVKVSVIGLGTMTWGEQNTVRDACQQLEVALEHGVNFVDTAEMYPVPPRAATQGATEKFLGECLKKSGKRNQIILATKASGPGNGLSYLRGGPRLTHAHIEQALEASLKRLQVSHIDLYQIHWPERSTNFFGKLDYPFKEDTDVVSIETTLESLDRCMRSGKIRMIGISNETPWGTNQYLSLAKQHLWPRIVSVQNPYSLLNRSYDIAMAEISHRESVGLLAYSPLGFGVLSGKYINGQGPPQARLSLFDRFTRYSNARAQDASARYVDLAKRYSLDPAQMALAFVHSRPFVASTLIGATTLEQLTINIESAYLRLPQTVLDEIDTIHALSPNPCP